MDPLTALSLAGTVIQFVQFVSGLLSSAAKIHDSITGSTSDGDYLESISSRLADLSGSLLNKASGTRTTQGTDEEAAMVKAAMGCKNDCDRLVELLRKIRYKQRHGPRWWSSFRTALLEVLNESEINTIRSRIEGYQNLAVYHMCATSGSVITV